MISCFLVQGGTDCSAGLGWYMTDSFVNSIVFCIHILYNVARDFLGDNRSTSIYKLSQLKNFRWSCKNRDQRNHINSGLFTQL
jgi:hypothetical protein